MGRGAGNDSLICRKAAGPRGGIAVLWLIRAALTALTVLISFTLRRVHRSGEKGIEVFGVTALAAFFPSVAARLSLGLRLWWHGNSLLRPR